MKNKKIKQKEDEELSKTLPPEEVQKVIKIDRKTKIGAESIEISVIL